MFLTAAVVSSIGFKRFIWFISIGYGFSIAAIGAGLMILFRGIMTEVTIAMSLLFVIYGLRLGGYLFLREMNSASYRRTMRMEINDGSTIRFPLKILIWLACALLYVCETAPVLFRLMNGQGDDVMSIIGLALMALGILMESAADYTKNRFKKEYPNHFCTVGLFRLVRCPNYLGEILTWTGVFISGIPAYHHPLQWAAAIFGWVAIVYIMFGGARRLELRQNRNYGRYPEYKRYVRTVPILIPFVPLYSVADYWWLVG